MAKQVINIGTVANDGTGDYVRDAFDKVNDNFDEVYGYETSLTTAQLNAAEVNYTDTYWEDLNINTGIFEFLGTADPALVNWPLTEAGIIVKAYEFALNDEVFFKIQCPHQMKTGTHLWAHLHWTPGSRGVAESGNKVGWKVDFTVANINSVFGPKYTLDLSDACDGVNDKHQMTPNIEQDVGSTFNISAFIIGRIYRSDTGTDDTWSSTRSGELPLLLGFDFHYETDSPGSREISSK